MEEDQASKAVESDIDDLGRVLHEHASAGAEFVPELTRALERIGEHVAGLHRRLERLEQNQNEWTTRGWEPPPGGGQRPGAAV